MIRKCFKLLAFVVFGIALVACSKGEDTPITQQQGGGASPHEASPGIMMPAGEPQIVVPDSVKNKWKAVVITIEDKTNNTTEDVTIPLNSTHEVKGSNLKIKVGDFLPDFKMDGVTITSSSNEPNNPAVRIIVSEGDEEIFKGWLYSKFPAIHPFQHEKYGLLLKEGIKS